MNLRKQINAVVQELFGAFLALKQVPDAQTAASALQEAVASAAAAQAGTQSKRRRSVWLFQYFEITIGQTAFALELSVRCKNIMHQDDDLHMLASIMMSSCYGSVMGLNGSGTSAVTRVAGQLPPNSRHFLQLLMWCLFWQPASRTRPLRT